GAVDADRRLRGRPELGPERRPEVLEMDAAVDPLGLEEVVRVGVARHVAGLDAVPPRRAERALLELGDHRTASAGGVAGRAEKNSSSRRALALRRASPPHVLM